MFAIFKKELRAYFTNPVGYVYIGIFLAASALICAFTTYQQATYDASGYFQFLLLMMGVLIPLLTMRLLSEERKTRTEQLLLTAPVSLTGMVLGKYLAALTLFGASVLVSCINLFPLVSYSIIEQSNATSDVHVGIVGGQVIGCLFGVLLVGAAFIAIGLFISCLTESQLSAAVITISVLMVMMLSNIFNSIINSVAVRAVLNWISILARFDRFAVGMFDFSAVLYYVSIAGIFIFLTVRMYDKRRWG